MLDYEKTFRSVKVSRFSNEVILGLSDFLDTEVRTDKVDKLCSLIIEMLNNTMDWKPSNLDILAETSLVPSQNELRIIVNAIQAAQAQEQSKEYKAIVKEYIQDVKLIKKNKKPTPPIKEAIERVCNLYDKIGNMCMADACSILNDRILESYIPL